MAKYRILGERYTQHEPYMVFEPGEIVTLPDDHLPNSGWEPLDAPAEAAMTEQHRLNDEKQEWAASESKNQQGWLVDGVPQMTGKSKTAMPMPRPPYDGPVKARIAARVNRKRERQIAALETVPPPQPSTMSEMQRRGPIDAIDAAAIPKQKGKSKRAADQEPT